MPITEIHRPSVAQKREALDLVTGSLSLRKFKAFPKDKLLLIRAIAGAEVLNDELKGSVSSVGIYSIKGEKGLRIIPETDTSTYAALGWAHIISEVNRLAETRYKDRPHTLLFEARTRDEIGAENVTPVVILNLGVPPMPTSSQFQ